MRLKDGRLVCLLRTHVDPSGDAKNMVMAISEYNDFSWTPARWLNIWGYAAEGVTWDVDQAIGYSCTVAASDGALFTVFYGQDRDGVTCIQGT